MKRIDNQRMPARSSSGTSSGAAPSEDGTSRPEVSAEVRRIRTVVTSLEEQPSVSDEVAPMMSEFLARLDGMSEPPPLLHLPPVFGDKPLSPPEVADTVRSAVDAVAQSEFGSRMRDDGPVAQMISEVKSFLELRRTCIARSSNSAQ